MHKFFFIALFALAALPVSAATSKSKSKTSSTAESKPAATGTEAKLTINPKEFGPLSTIELTFATPMIPKERVGTEESEAPLTVVPPLGGKFEWTSTRSGIYRLTEAPKFSSGYRFDLKAGLKDMEGRAVVATKLKDVSTEKFRIVEQYPRWLDENDISRTQSFLFEFNDPVMLDTVASVMAFKCEETKEKVPVAVRFATGRDFRRQNADPHPTWAETIANKDPKLADDAVRESAIVVTPEHPLSPGKGWALDIAATITNQSKTSKLDTGDLIHLGDIKAFEINEITAHSPFDSPRYIEIAFNRNLINEDLTGDDRRKEIQTRVAAASPQVKIEPAVADVKFDITDESFLRVTGGFELGKEYHVTVGAEISSHDDLKLAAAGEATLKFEANPPYLSASSFIHAQLAMGKGDFEFHAANVSQVRMRAKKLTGPELLQTIHAYQPYVGANGSRDREERRKFTPKPFDEYPGAVIFDRTFPVNKPVDQSTLVEINWKEVLGAANAAPLFIELEGAAMPGLDGKSSIAQTLVEFTDIGLFHKSDYRTSTVLAVSLATGKPMPAVQLTLVDKDHRLLGHGVTDANGMASIGAVSPAFVLAEKGTDSTALEVEGYDTVVPLWHFSLSTAWKSPWRDVRKTFLFADRPLFKPGETAHLKAYTRVANGDELKLDPAQTKALLQIRDPRAKVVIEKKVTFSANGSWSDDVLLPAAPTGWYNAAIRFPDDGDEDTGGSVQLRVDDYRPNTFEVKFDSTKLSIAPDRIRVPLTASYYMGKPLTKSKVMWNAFRMEDHEMPEQWRSYQFGDAPSWAAYGKDETEVDDRHAVSAEEWSASGENTIGDDGTLSIEMPTPPALKTVMPQKLRIEAEVTDINEQTISGSTEISLPGAAFIIGLAAKDYFANAGKETSVEAVAVTPEGKPWSTDVPVKFKLERQSYHSIKVKAAGGGETVKNQVVLEEELNSTGTLKAATPQHAASLTIPITPRAGGRYFLTIEANDPGGKALLTRLPVFVIGGGEFPWAIEDGAAIDLQPDKTTLKPGEKANIIVKTPIAGTALVTVERNKVQRTFQTPVSPDQPMIEIAVGEEDAPNVFVSVVVIRGAQDSPQKVKMPEYKMGYCKLKVETTTHDLKIAVKPEQPEVKPGEPAAIVATITDGAAKPVANAEVTLAAVDEGVLSLMSYVTPAPQDYFHAEVPLAVSNHTNFSSVVTEDAKARAHGNKGFVVGGGGDEQEPQIDTRKNFLTTALWTATAMTDANGVVKTSFTAPDNLTRYRLMAFASEGATRFGSAQSQVIINKPLMIEPALPRFARIDDELIVKAVVHNTTAQSGSVEVQFTIDERADFISDERPFIVTNATAEASKPEGKVWKKVVPLKAKETAAVAFPVKFAKMGEAKWNWQVKTTQWSDATALSDRMESTFQVEHSVAAQREVRYVNVSGSSLPDNLLKDVPPAILEGEGTLSVTVSNSRLPEIADALEYVLHYPYGCVEQTSSSMLPWLALGGFEDMFPGQLDAKQRKDAIQRGVNRLLAMVTEHGGLSYWPGGKEPNLSGSAYGGWVLLKAREAGAAVPKEVTDELLDYLSKQLRHVDDERDTTTLVDDAFALYTLSKGGKPEPGYANMLYLRRAKLPPIGKLFLALSMCIDNAPEAQIKTLITEGGDNGKWTHWSGSKVNNALKLIAQSHIGMTNEAKDLLTNVLASRNSRGEWGNTFTNGWTLYALAGYERSLKRSDEPLTVNLAWGEQKSALELPTPAANARWTQPLTADQIKLPLKLDLPKDRQTYARIEAKSWPALKEFGGANNGYGISRVYEKLLPDGNTEGLDDLRIGDMVVVRLTVDIPGGDRYLAINDPLPAVFEAVNPEFDTANVRHNAADKGIEAWFCDHRELHSDCAQFFTDYAPGKGKFELTYLARVVAEGDVIAPSARIEAMYEPDKNGLSATQRIKSLPSAGKPVASK
jgi:uncharacterized protein YfaS (alpha-2-macroglobulin family)